MVNHRRFQSDKLMTCADLWQTKCEERQQQAGTIEKILKIADTPQFPQSVNAPFPKQTSPFPKLFLMASPQAYLPLHLEKKALRGHDVGSPSSLTRETAQPSEFAPYCAVLLCL